MGSRRSINRKICDKCYIFPHEKLNKTIQLVEKLREKYESNTYENANFHKANLVKLKARNTSQCISLRDTSATTSYLHVLRNTILAHDWDKLLFLLKKWPLHQMIKIDIIRKIVYRAYMIFLFYHPNARAQSLPMHFCHFVLGCRNDDDKKAFMKILVSLPDKLVQVERRGKFETTDLENVETTEIETMETTDLEKIETTNIKIVNTTDQEKMESTDPKIVELETTDPKIVELETTDRFKILNED